jgi:hypothetical protein
MQYGRDGLFSHGHHALLVALAGSLVTAPLLATRHDVVDSQEENCSLYRCLVDLDE